MEENEEIIKQEEIEAEAQAADENGEETPPPIPPSQDKTEPMSPKRPRNTGILLTVFAVVVIVLIGGLASYYYYTFQRQGMASERVLTNVWDETVLATINITKKFDTIKAFKELDDTGKDSFETIINDANRTIRDGIFDIRSQTGMDISTSTFSGKLNSFLDDYSSMLTELKRIIARVEDIDDVKELDQLLVYQDNMEKSYDDLLLVSGSFIQANLPRAIFDMPDDILSLLKKQLDEQGSQSEQDKAARQAAEQTVNQFVQAWQSRDGDGMATYLTAGAKSEFSRGILEDSSDIVTFRILKTELTEDGSNITIEGRLDKKTPDNAEVSESWEFVLLNTQDSWLIDSWSQK